MFTMGPPLWAGGGDPLFGSVRALLHFDNNILDSSSVGNIATSSNLAYDSVSVGPSFGACGDFTHGSNEAVVTLPTSSALSVGAEDFTLEFWYYRVSPNGSIYFLWGDGDNSDIWFYTGPGATLSVYFLGAERLNLGSLPVGAWSHIAITRASTTRRIFINGVLVDSMSGASSNMGTTASWRIGSAVALAGGGTGGRCYIDEFRLTVGAARYTAAFAPPTAPFANS